jgi:chemotaxis receptor (MCP) glutamine deamidase CheD
MLSLALDTIVAMDVVLADGRFVHFTPTTVSVRVMRMFELCAPK